MVVRRQSKPLPESSRRRSATTPEARESQMINLAERLAEQQMEDGSASAQVITHFLKLGSSREQLEKQRLSGEVELQKAKIEAMASTQRLEEMYTRAMDAFRGYQGHPPEDEENA